MMSTLVGLDLPVPPLSRWARRLIASVTFATAAAGAFAQSYTISTLAGNGTPGSTDSTGGTPTFSNPTGVAVDGFGNVYVADTGNSRIRKISSVGVVSTLASSGFSGPNAVAVDGAGNVYVADTNNQVIKKVDGAGTVTIIAGATGVPGDSVPGPVAGNIARFRSPWGIAVHVGGTFVYVADTGNHVIRRIDLGSGIVTTIAGTQGSPGTGAAQFNNPSGLALFGNTLYVADRENHGIRKIDLIAGNAVTTFAGTLGGSGTSDTPPLFHRPHGVAVDGAGNLFVTDANHTIRRITSTGTVSTIAGSPGFATFAEGVGTAARFSGPWGIGVDISGNFYVGDSNNQRIRKGTLGAAPTAPTINAHPSNATFTIGGTSAIFTVSSPNGLTYQ
jgi:DNA-binding beta-propeller fold protein YncE